MACVVATRNSFDQNEAGVRVAGVAESASSVGSRQSRLQRKKSIARKKRTARSVIPRERKPTGAHRKRYARSASPCVHRRFDPTEYEKRRKERLRKLRNGGKVGSNKGSDQRADLASSERRSRTSRSRNSASAGRKTLDTSLEPKISHRRRRNRSRQSTERRRIDEKKTGARAVAAVTKKRGKSARRKKTRQKKRVDRGPRGEREKENVGPGRPARSEASGAHPAEEEESVSRRTEKKASVKQHWLQVHSADLAASLPQDIDLAGKRSAPRPTPVEDEGRDEDTVLDRT